MTAPQTPTLLADRAVILLSPLDDGENVAAFLQGLLTNDVTGELPAYAALLSAQGKTMFDTIVWPGGPGEHGASILLDSAALSLGVHTIEVLAVDAVGIAASDDVTIEIEGEETPALIAESLTMLVCA